MDEFQVIAIRKLNAELSHDDIDVMGIVCKTLNPEPKLCKRSPTKYALSFTIKGIDIMRVFALYLYFFRLQNMSYISSYSAQISLLHGSTAVREIANWWSPYLPMKPLICQS